MDKFKSKNGASVSEVFALFNWSSVGYIWPTNNLECSFDPNVAQQVVKVLYIVLRIHYRVGEVKRVKERALVCTLVWIFAGHQYDKNQNLAYWII